jgi:hypothetical protein
MGYDEWLEQPYTDAARRQDDYEQWCEYMGYDANEDHWDEFDEAISPED